MHSTITFVWGKTTICCGAQFVSCNSKCYMYILCSKLPFCRIFSVNIFSAFLSLLEQHTLRDMVPYTVPSSIQFLLIEDIQSIFDKYSN